jgi:hemoglobin/transferrin/lactoferrin receptor protein
LRYLVFSLLFFYLSFLVAQDTLRIVDEAGNPLPYAVVGLLPDTSYLGTADDQGRLALPKDLNPEADVRVEYIGYGVFTRSFRRLARGGYVFRLEGGQTTLDMPTVVGRRNEIADELPYQVEMVNSKEITRAQPLTTADALANLSGVYVQKSQFGGGSPVVRGFEANRLLLVVDGVRMNNAIFRNGHLQNAITVDPLALDRLELIYGAGALAYGSDALGGVVHFRTQEPVFKVGYQGYRAGPQEAKWQIEGAMITAPLPATSVKASSWRTARRTLPASPCSLPPLPRTCAPAPKEAANSPPSVCAMNMLAGKMVSMW